jgi:hypothetical protein
LDYYDRLPDLLDRFGHSDIRVPLDFEEPSLAVNQFR